MIQQKSPAMFSLYHYMYLLLCIFFFFLELIVESKVHDMSRMYIQLIVCLNVVSFT